MFDGILLAIRNKIKSFRCIMKCGSPINGKNIDIQDEELGL